MNTPDFRNDPQPRSRLALGLGTLALLVAPIAATAGGHRSTTHSSTSGYFFSDDDDSHFGWSLFDPKDGNVTGNTDGDDWRDIHRALDDEAGRVFWFKIDADRYVVRDPGVVARVSDITDPIRELGKKQGELGRQQAELSRKASVDLRKIADEALRDGKAQKLGGRRKTI